MRGPARPPEHLPSRRVFLTAIADQQQLYQVVIVLSLGHVGARVTLRRSRDCRGAAAGATLRSGRLPSREERQQRRRRKAALQNCPAWWSFDCACAGLSSCGVSSRIKEVETWLTAHYFVLAARMARRRQRGGGGQPWRRNCRCRGPVRASQSCRSALHYDVKMFTSCRTHLDKHALVLASFYLTPTRLSLAERACRLLPVLAREQPRLPVQWYHFRYATCSCTLRASRLWREPSLRPRGRVGSAAVETNACQRIFACL